MGIKTLSEVVEVLEVECRWRAIEMKVTGCAGKREKCCRSLTEQVGQSIIKLFRRMVDTLNEGRLIKLTYRSRGR